MKRLGIGLILSLLCIHARAQYVYQTFKDTRVINTHAVETLQKGQLDFRVGHRFGDALGDRGGWQTFYGLESASDVMIGFDYGITNNIMVGISRTKGTGELRQNVNGLAKWKVIHQNKEKNFPLSLTFLGVWSTSTQEATEGAASVTAFTKPQHRMVFHSAVLAARKFSQWWSLQLGAGLTHRNLVIQGNDNDIINLSVSTRVQLTKGFGVILDGNFMFASAITKENGYYPALGMGLEWETGGGHVFQLNFTNSTGIMVTDYVPNTRSNWADGEFRMGFTISRQFKI